MAQVTGGWNFDMVWEEWTNRSLLLLREAANAYAAGGEEAIDPSVVVASFLGVLSRPRPANPFYFPKWPLRFFDGTHLPPKVTDSLTALGETLGNQEVETALTDLIRSAAHGWAEGDPEVPETRVVLRDALEILWSRRLIPHPP